MFRTSRFLGLLVFASILFAVSAVSPTIASNGPPRPNPTSCVYQEVAGPKYYATPVILVNSPYLGNASATSTQTYTSGFAIGGLGSQTSTSNGESISVSDGQAGGVFQIDGWYIYAIECPNVVGYAAKIGTTTVSGQTLWCTVNLLGQGSSSDSGEPTTTSCTVDGVNYPSISFSNGYASNSGYVSTCGGPGTTFYTSTTTEVQYSLTVSVGNYVSDAGTASLTSSSTQSYQYNFPSGGQWAYQELTSSSGSAWSFDYTGC